MHALQISFLCILAAAVMCSAHIGGKVPSQDLNQAYCGRALASALAYLCDPTITSKRFDTGMYSAVLSSPYYKERDMHVGWPWIGPYKAREITSRRGKRELVVTECCEKACSTDELMTYC